MRKMVLLGKGYNTQDFIYFYFPRNGLVNDCFDSPFIILFTLCKYSNDYYPRKLTLR